MNSKELVLDGHNCPTWAMGVKMSLSLRGMYEAITPPSERQHELSPSTLCVAL
jgi:formylmethanofuran dehydrogenase subunit E